jgi:hypothetical protein
MFINTYYCSLCDVGPSVNTFLIFHIFRIVFLNSAHVNTFEGSTDFSFKTQFFALCLNFQQQNPLKKKEKKITFPTLALKIVK